MAMFNQALNPTHLSRFGKNLQWTGRQLQMSFTLPIMLAAGAATKFALDNDRAITQVRKVYGDLGDTTHNVGGELKALETTFSLLSSQMGVHMNEVIDIAAAWAEAGSQGVGLAKSTQTTMQAMILGGMDAQKATEGLIAIQAAFALSSDDLRQTLYDLNVVENDTGISLEGLVDVLARAGGVARTSGIQIKELAALAASIVPAAGSASQAGNALRTIISRIMSPTKEAGELMAQMGIDIMSAGWQSQDAMGRIQTLAKAFENLSDSQQTVVTSAIASRWQLNRADIMFREINSTTGFYATTLKALNGDIDTQTQSLAELDKFLGSDSRRWDILLNSVRNAMTQAIQPALPAIFALVTRFSQLAQAFGNLSPQTKQWIILGLALLAVIGPLARIIGGFSLLFGTVGSAVGILTKFLFGNVIAWTSYSVATNAAGQASVVASRKFALSGGILSKLLMTLYDLAGFGYSLLVVKPADAILAASRMVSSSLASLWTAAVGTAQTAALGIMYVWDAIVTAGQTAAFGVAYAWSVIWPAVVSAAETAMLTIMVAFSWMQANWLSVVRTIPLFATTAWTAMSEALLSLSVSMSMGIASAWAAMSEAIAMIVIGIQSYMQLAMWKVQEVWTVGTTAIVRAWYLGQAMLMNGMVALSGFMSTAWLTIQTVAVNTVAGIQVAFATFIQGFPALMRSLPLMWTTIMTAMSRAWITFQITASTGAQAMMATVKAAMANGFRSILASTVSFMTAETAILGLPLWAAVGVVLAVVATIAAIIENFYQDGIRGFITDIRDGLYALPQIFANAFRGVINVLSRAIEVIADQLSYLNPFQRHSPSLVDNVTNGISVILGEYARLRGIPSIMASATRALQDFNAATNAGKASLDAKEQAENRADIVAVSPQAGPAVDNLYRSLNQLRPALAAIGDEVAAQETVVANWKTELDAANRTLDEQEAILSRLKDVASANKDALDSARAVLDNLTDTPIAGMQAFSDAIFENEMAQKRLQLQMLEMGDAGGDSIDKIRDRIAALQGDIETLRGQATELRQAGAGSDVLGPIENQITTLENAQAALSGGAAGNGGLSDLQAQLEELQRQGQILDLQNSLQFDPLKRQIDAVTNSMTEMPFDELLAQIKAQQGEVDRLNSIWQASEDAVTGQQAAVDQAKAARDALSVAYDAESARLDTLRDAYAAVEQQIKDMESALNDFAQASRSAKAGGSDPSMSSQMFDAAAGFDFEPVGGTGGIGREGELIDIEQFNKDLQAQMDEAMKGLGKLDLFKPIKDKFKEAWDWIKRNAKNIIIGVFIAIGFMIFEAVAFIPAVIVEVIAAGLYLLFGPAVFKAIWDAFAGIMGSIWQLIQTLWEPIGDVFTAIFSGIGDAAIWAWDNMIKPAWEALGTFFTDVIVPIIETLGSVFGTIFDAIGSVVSWVWNNILKPLLSALWNFVDTYVIPVLQLLGAIAEIIFVSIARIVGWAWNEIIKPIFDAIWWVITNVLVPVFQLVAAIVALAFGGIAKLFTDVVGPIFMWLLHEVIEPVMGAIGGVIQWAWENVIKPVFDAIWGFIAGTMGPIFHWLLDEVISPVFSAIGSVIGGVWSAITTGFREAINFFIKAFNTIVGGVKRLSDFLHIDVNVSEIPEIGAFQGSGQGGSVPPARRMHSGGLVDGPFGLHGLRSDETYKILQRGEYVIPSTGVSKVSSGPVLDRGAGSVSNEFHFHGDLSFPNVTNGADADAFLRNLESLSQ